VPAQEAGGEDLPSPDNRVRLDAQGRVPVDYTPSNSEAHTRLIQKLAQGFGASERAGFAPSRDLEADRMPVRVCSHQCGSARFGKDPKTSRSG
jgi:hypothetical protein